MEKSVSIKATKKEVLLYSFGGIGSNLAFIFVMSFLTVFFVTVLKMNPLAVGTLFLVSRFIDAITDPLMGMIADRTKTKHGKYRPYIFIGAPILGLATIALFTPLKFSSAEVASINPGLQLAFAYVTYIGYSLASTVVNIPYHALTPVLSNDSNQRAMIASSKQAFATIGTMIPAVLTIPMVKLFSNELNPFQALIDGIKAATAIEMKFGDVFPAIEGIVPTQLVGVRYSNDFLLLDPQAWFITAVILSVIMTISFLICQYGAKDKDTYQRALDVQPKERITFKAQLKVIFQNKPLLMLMIAFTTDMVAYAAANGLNIYYWKDVVGDSSFVVTIALLGALSALPFIMLIPKLSRKYGKKAVLVGGSIFTSILYLIIFLVPTQNVTLLLVLFIIATGASTIPATVGWGMIPDCVEYGEWQHGIRGEATISSGLTFVNKFGMAIGGFITGLALTLIGYNATATVQSGVTLKGIIFIRCIFPIIGYICSVIAMKYYDLSNAKYDTIVQEIADRKKENS